MILSILLMIFFLFFLGEKMEVAEYIKMALVKKKMNERKLSAAIGEAPQNVNRKLKSDMKISFIESIANALDCDIDIQFIDRKTGKPLF